MMRNRLALLSLTLCIGTTAWASPVQQFARKEPKLLVDPISQATQLAPILKGIQWFAEQQAIRTRILFPKERMEADVPIGPKWVPTSSNGL